MNDTPEKEVNILILGDHGTGKTSFIEKITSGLFEEKYFPTSQTHKYIFSLFTVYGKVNISLFDNPGCFECAHSNVQNYSQIIDGAIIFHSREILDSQRNVEVWKKIFGNEIKIPLVECNNKQDSLYFCKLLFTSEFYTNYLLSVRNCMDLLKPVTTLIDMIFEQEIPLDLRPSSEPYLHFLTLEKNTSEVEEFRKYLLNKYPNGKKLF